MLALEKKVETFFLSTLQGKASLRHFFALCEKFPGDRFDIPVVCALRE